MKPHPRIPIIRKTIKWGGAVVSVVFLGVWVASWWIGAHTGYATWPWDVWVSRGCVEVSRYTEVLGTSSAPIGSRPPRSEWWPSYQREPYSWEVRVPIWTFALPLAAITITAWRRDRLARERARAHVCFTCGYDRTGLAPGVVCPECGAAAHASAP